MITKLNPTERELAHKYFKFYKATGRFPPNVKPIEAWLLMNKFNYFIAVNLNTKKLQRLMKLGELLVKKHIVLSYGDITIDSLKFAVNSVFMDNESHYEYIDCKEYNKFTELCNSIHTKTLTNSRLVYILDNVETLKKKKYEVILRMLEFIENYDKYIILCAYSLNKVAKPLQSTISKIKVGTSEIKKTDLKKCLLYLFCHKNRDFVSNYLKGEDIFWKYFLKLAMYNLGNFYEYNISALIKNSDLITQAATNLFKVSTEKVIDFLVYSFIPSEKKKLVQFPPKLEQNLKKEPEVTKVIDHTDRSEQKRVKLVTPKIKPKGSNESKNKKSKSSPKKIKGLRSF